LPDKGDVSDWLQAGGTKEEILRLTACAPEWSASDVLAYEAVPTEALLKLRDVELGPKIERYATLLPHGGMTFVDGIDLNGLAHVGNQCVNFYKPLDDVQRFDMVAIWLTAMPMCVERKEHKQDVGKRLFAHKSRQVFNWTSWLRFVERERWRPHLGMWIHRELEGLTPEQQEVVFDTYEGNRSMKRDDVRKMVQNLRDGIEPEHLTRNRTGRAYEPIPFRPRSEWEQCAQYYESVQGGDRVATHLNSLARVHGAGKATELITSIPLRNNPFFTIVKNEAYSEEPEDSLSSSYEHTHIEDKPIYRRPCAMTAETVRTCLECLTEESQDKSA
jgi:hypothetical protein